MRRRDAGDPERTVDRRVGLVGQIDRRPRTLAPGAFLQRDRQGGEVGRRAAADEQALGARRQSAQLAQPVQHDQLDHRRARRREPGAGEHAEAGGQQIAHCADRVARHGREGEEPGMVDPQPWLEHVAQRRVEHGVGIAARLRQRFAQARLHRLATGRSGDRVRVERLEATDDRVHGRVAEPAHRLGLQRQPVIQRRGDRDHRATVRLARARPHRPNARFGLPIFAPAGLRRARADGPRSPPAPGWRRRAWPGSATRGR